MVTGFEDPLLTRFISLAVEQNRDIAQATARIAQSRASLRLADAALLPSANGRTAGAWMIGLRPERPAHFIGEHHAAHTRLVIHLRRERL